MSFIRFWNRPSHTLLQSTCLDDVDELTAGKTFSVRYLGRVDVHENHECNFTSIADAIFKQYKKDKLEKLIRLEVFLDMKGLEIRDHFTGEKKVLFAIPLSDVREVLHRKKDNAYKNVFIFVAREQPLDPMLKAHVLLCESPEITATLFETFQSAFSLYPSFKSTSSTSYTAREKEEATIADSECHRITFTRDVESNNNEPKREPVVDGELEMSKTDETLKNFIYTRM